MYIECSPTSIPDHEGEVDVRVRDAALHDECPVEKGLMVQLLHLPCDELLEVVERRQRCTGAQTCSLSLLQDGFLWSHREIEMEKT